MGACLTLLKHPPTRVTMTNLTALGQTVCVYVWGPKNFGDGGDLSLGMGAWLSSWKYAPPPRVVLPNVVILGQMV